MGRRVRVRLGLGSTESGRAQSQDIFEVDAWPAALRNQVDRNLQALARYRPRPYAGEVTLFRAHTSPLLHSFTEDLGWRIVAGDRVRNIRISGNHKSILQQPHLAKLAEAFGSALR